MASNKKRMIGTKVVIQMKFIDGYGPEKMWIGKWSHYYCEPKG